MGPEKYDHKRDGAGLAAGPNKMQADDEIAVDPMKKPVGVGTARHELFILRVHMQQGATCGGYGPRKCRIVGRCPSSDNG